MEIENRNTQKLTSEFSLKLFEDYFNYLLFGVLPLERYAPRDIVYNDMDDYLPEPNIKETSVSKMLDLPNELLHVDQASLDSYVLEMYKDFPEYSMEGNACLMGQLEENIVLKPIQSQEEALASLQEVFQSAGPFHTYLFTELSHPEYIPEKEYTEFDHLDHLVRTHMKDTEKERPTADKSLSKKKKSVRKNKKESI